MNWAQSTSCWLCALRYAKVCGIDGVRAEDILGRENGVETFLSGIHDELKSKIYRPSAVKRVYIPKADGKKRPLGIPTLKDRVVQMAAVLILEPIFEADFHDCSHGFRPGRKAHDALDAIRENLKAGRTEVYDADLIPHDKLMACVRMRVTDRSVLSLLRGWLRAPIIGNNCSNLTCSFARWRSGWFKSGREGETPAGSNVCAV